MIFPIVAGLLIIYLFWRIFKHDDRLLELAKKLPGPTPLPILGNLFDIHISGPKSFSGNAKLFEQYGPLFRLWIGTKLCVMLSDPDDIQAILTNNALITKSFTYEFTHKWIGTGLLTSTGAKWHMRRKAISPTFHFGILEKFVEVFNKSSDILINNLSLQAGKDFFDVFSYTTNFSLDVICETSMGTEVHAQQEKDSPYVKGIKDISYHLAERINKSWLQSEFLYIITGNRYKEEKILKNLHAMTDKVIENNIKNYSNTTSEEQEDENGAKKRPALIKLALDLKMKGDKAFQTLGDVREEVSTFIFEGQDTTSTALAFTLLLLGKHPQEQENVFNEQKQIFGDDNRAPTYYDLQEMNYLERVIKENLRLFPIAPIIGRHITEEITLPSGYTLPVGCTVFINIHATHHNKKNFANPTKFDPDRFLPENFSKRHPYSYIPFSAGPRNCVGQKYAVLELKMAISKIIRKFEVKTEAEVVPDVRLVLRNLAGFPIKLTLRN